MSVDLNAAVIAKHLRIDPPRAERKVRLEVDAVGHGVIISGHLFEMGRQTVELYESDIPKVMSMVEDATETELALVRADHERHRSEPVDQPSDRGALPSMVYSFKRILLREPRPFRSARVLEDDEKKSKRAA